MGAGLDVIRVFHRPDHVLRADLGGLGRPDAADGVGSLVGGPGAGTFRSFPLLERKRRERLDGVREDVERRAGDGHPGKGPGVVGVDDAQAGTQRPVRDPGLGVHLGEVEDGHGRRLAAGAGRRRDGDQRLERPWHGRRPADGRVHVFEEVGRVGGVEVRHLRRVDGGASADGDVAVELAGGREGDGLFERDVGRLHPHLVVHDGVDTLRPEGLRGRSKPSRSG